MKKSNTQMLAQIMTSMSDFNEDECYLVQQYVNALRNSRGTPGKTYGQKEKTPQKRGALK